MTAERHDAPLGEAEMLIARRQWCSSLGWAKQPYPGEAGIAGFGAGWRAAARLSEIMSSVEAAARKMLAASDQFVRDTGLEHSDLITDAAEELRSALKNADPQDAVTENTAKDHAPAESAPPAVPCVVVPIEVLDFLMGCGQLEGRYFGDIGPLNDKFWWRKFIRRAAGYRLPYERSSP